MKWLNITAVIAVLANIAMLALFYPKDEYSFWQAMIVHQYVFKPLFVLSIALPLYWLARNKKTAVLPVAIILVSCALYITTALIFYSKGAGTLFELLVF